MFCLKINATWCDKVPFFFWFCSFLFFKYFFSSWNLLGVALYRVCNWIDEFKRHFQIVADVLDHLFKMTQTKKENLSIELFLLQNNKNVTFNNVPAKFAAAIPRRCFASIAPLKPRPNPKSTVRFELQK